jgi:Asp-tRNA(Asn)/Glu-tRNA(Gln) amidotransferase A subunit family amidase
VFGPKVTDARILAHFETTVAELRAAGAEVVDPFFVEGFEKIPRPPQTPSRFKADLTAWIAAHPGVPYPSVSAIAESKLLHPLHQAGFEDAVKARLPEEDPANSPR